VIYILFRNGSEDPLDDKSLLHQQLDQVSSTNYSFIFHFQNFMNNSTENKRLTQSNRVAIKTLVWLVENV